MRQRWFGHEGRRVVSLGEGKGGRNWRIGQMGNGQKLEIDEQKAAKHGEQRCTEACKKRKKKGAWKKCMHE